MSSRNEAKVRSDSDPIFSLKSDELRLYSLMQRMKQVDNLIQHLQNHSADAAMQNPRLTYGEHCAFTPEGDFDVEGTRLKLADAKTSIQSATDAFTPDQHNCVKALIDKAEERRIAEDEERREEERRNEIRQQLFSDPEWMQRWRREKNEERKKKKITDLVTSDEIKPYLSDLEYRICKITQYGDPAIPITWQSDRETFLLPSYFALHMRIRETLMEIVEPNDNYPWDFHVGCAKRLLDRLAHRMSVHSPHIHDDMVELIYDVIHGRRYDEVRQWAQKEYSQPDTGGEEGADASGAAGGA